MIRPEKMPSKKKKLAHWPTHPDQKVIDWETRAAVRRSDPDTSYAAWEAVKPTIRERHQQIMELILASDLPGLTTSEIAAELDLPRDSVSPRMPELVRKNLIRDTGIRRKLHKKQTRQIVWIDRWRWWALRQWKHENYNALGYKFDENGG